jgi:predicted phosphodiesterase
MKIAVLTDIHANLPALEAVAAHIEAWHPDRVVVAGDLVNRGPRPLECQQFVLEKQKNQGWLTVRGNHEDYVITNSLPDAPRTGPALDVHRGSFWTYQKLGGDIRPLLDMPFQQSLDGPNGTEVRVVHASMRNNRDGIYPETRDEALRKQLGIPPALLCVGHTHRSLVRWLDDTLVVNAGSVGLPFDHDRRAGYAQLSWSRNTWRAQIIRLDYDFMRAERDFFDTNFITDAGPLAQLVLIELRQARSQLFQWAARYQDRALAGEISVQDSVREFLDLK